MIRYHRSLFTVLAVLALGGGRLEAQEGESETDPTDELYVLEMPPEDELFTPEAGDDGTYQP